MPKVGVKSLFLDFYFFSQIFRSVYRPTAANGLRIYVNQPALITFASAYQFHVFYCYLLGLGSFAALLIEALLIVAAGAGWDVHQRVRVLELGGHGGQTPRAGLLQQGQAGRVPLTLHCEQVWYYSVFKIISNQDYQLYRDRFSPHYSRI